jgi:S-adenosyl-L-methionine methyltransferase
LSRLDSFLRRLQAQRDCLNAAAALIASRPGPVFELGLGNGRTYDHLRELFPEREIFVFERKAAAHPDCIPDADHLFEGPIDDTLAAAAARFAGRVALVHGDLGSGYPEIDARTAATVSARLPVLMAPGGIIVSEQKLNLPAAEEVTPPSDVREGRYYMHRWPNRQS